MKKAILLALLIVLFGSGVGAADVIVVYYQAKQSLPEGFHSWTNPLDGHLVFSYDMSETNAAGVLQDQGPRSNDGTLKPTVGTGPTVRQILGTNAADRISYYATCDGIDDYIQAADNDIHSIGCTIAAWIRLPAIQEFNVPIFSRHTEWSGIQITTNEGVTNLVFYYDATALKYDTGGTLQTDTWYHVAGSYLQGVGPEGMNFAAVYLNGEKKAETTVNTGDVDIWDYFKLGYDDVGRYSALDLRYVEYYQTNHTAAQVSNLWYHTRPTHDVRYY